MTELSSQIDNPGAGIRHPASNADPGFDGGQALLPPRSPEFC